MLLCYVLFFVKDESLHLAASPLLRAVTTPGQSTTQGSIPGVASTRPSTYAYGSQSAQSAMWRILKAQGAQSDLMTRADPSFCWFVCLAVSLSLYLPFSQSLSLCLSSASVSLPPCLSVSLSPSLPPSLSLYLSLALSLSLSIYIYIYI